MERGYIAPVSVILLAFRYSENECAMRMLVKRALELKVNSQLSHPKSGLCTPQQAMNAIQTQTRSHWERTCCDILSMRTWTVVSSHSLSLVLTQLPQ
jgi:hypothetical protein